MLRQFRVIVAQQGNRHTSTCPREQPAHLRCGGLRGHLRGKQEHLRVLPDQRVERLGDVPGMQRPT